MPDRKSKSPQQRTAVRLHHELPVAYKTISGFITDWAVNISRGGLFINTPKPLPVGTTVRLIISLPGTDFPFDLKGRVAHVNEFDRSSNQMPGMGIEFVNVDEEKRVQLETFVDRLRKELDEEDGSGHGGGHPH
jgi:uncharacterized protein (TIGR02266 family)